MERQPHLQGVKDEFFLAVSARDEPLVAFVQSVVAVMSSLDLRATLVLTVDRF